MCINSLTCCQAQISISCNYCLLLHRSPKQQAEMEMYMQKLHRGLLSGSPPMEGKGRWSAQAKGEAGCSTASTEVSANITGNSEVGRDFQSYPKLGLGDQAFVPPTECSHWMWAPPGRQWDLRRGSSFQLMKSSKGTKNWGLSAGSPPSS